MAARLSQRYRVPMTKPASKKIALNRETLRVLATVDLGRVAGGIDLGDAGSPVAAVPSQVAGITDFTRAKPAGYTWAE